MNEKTPQNGPIDDAAQIQDPGEKKYRDVSPEELREILEEHKRWLDSNEKEGQRANLRDANLEEAFLVEVNLQKANLCHANLQGATLRRANLQEAALEDANLQMAVLEGANLQKANLRSANLQQADLRHAALRKADLLQANLQDANLWHANLQEAGLLLANLQQALLMEANLQKAVLMEANLHGADLLGADLTEARLFKADFQEANLTDTEGLEKAEQVQYANLKNATGLLGNEFAQADVTGTVLPKDIAAFETLRIVEETSKNARKVFFAMLLGCVYSWLTIATTTDVRLLTNTASSPLPIIGTEIPIAWFYLAAPLVLVCLYFYFHFYLHGLWEALSGLPAKFPDGKRLDERAYPWMLNKLVRRHFKLLKEKRPLLAHQQELVTIFLAWLTVPLTLFAFWLRYLPRHDWTGTFLHIGLLTLTIGAARVFYKLTASTLGGKRLNKSDRMSHYVLVVFVIPFIALVLWGLSHGSINGIPWHYRKSYSISHDDARLRVPLLFQQLGYSPFADFREKDVSERPENYWLISASERIDSIKGANLRNGDIRFADMDYSFLVKADLRGAKLWGASLVGANLSGARLKETNLAGADLWGANLKEAVLSEANLKEANLTAAKLTKADVFQANLKKANLTAADLREAQLGEANLREADLTWANLAGAKNLTIGQLRVVKTLYKATLDRELMEQVKRRYPYLLEIPEE